MKKIAEPYENFNEKIRNFPRLYWLKLYIKYFFFQKKLRTSLKGIVSLNLEPHPKLKNNIFIPLLETSHYQYHQVLILAKALEQRGANVMVLVCDSFLPGCEIKSVKNESIQDPCLNCRFNQSHIVDLYDLNILKLSSLFNSKELSEIKEQADAIINSSSTKMKYGDEEITQIINDSITRYYYGGKPESEQDGNKIMFNHVFTTIIGFLASKKIDKSFKPDTIINSMPTYSTWRPYFQYFEKNILVKIFTVSITQFNYHSIIMNNMELYYSNVRYLLYKDNRKNNTLDTREFKELESFINQRKSGDSRIFSDWGYFNNDESNISKALNLDKSKTNVFLFSNIYWDIGISDCSTIYESVIEWVLDTIRIISNNSKMHLFIKIHPGEVFDSASSIKGMKDHIYERYPVLPLNVTLIMPELKINTYNLFSYIDLGIVYNGTVGLEMLLDEIPVIITGKSPYSDLNLVSEPKTKTDYEQMINDSSELLIAKKVDVELFAYFYFIKTCIPWNLTKSAYADDFKEFTFDSLEDILPGENKYLDHICNCVLKPEETIIEAW